MYVLYVMMFNKMLYAQRPRFFFSTDEELIYKIVENFSSILNDFFPKKQVETSKNIRNVSQD